jgi:hypothetical protein
LLFEGAFIDSFLMYPPTIPFLLTLLFLAGHLIFKVRKGAKIVVWLFASTASLIVINCTIKMITGSVFH